MKIALFQLDLVWENAKENQANIERHLANLEQGTEVVVLPEMFTTGFSMQAAQNAETMQGDSVAWMKAQAQKFQILLMGSLVIEDNGQYFNRLLAFAPDGNLLAKYDKRHLFRMANEHEHYKAGEERIIFKYKGWKICPLICYDLRFPVWSRNQDLAYDLLIYVANWPQRRVAHWEALAKARAIENQCFVAAVNRVGTDGAAIPYSGSSAILDFLGNELTQQAAKEEILYATLDKNAMEQYRNSFPAWRDADHFQMTWNGNL
ncbi:MAG: amidohydrolase [Bacteroidia bacterium]